MRLLRTQLTNAAQKAPPSSTRPRRTRLRVLLGVAVILAIAADVTSFVSFIGRDG